MNHHALTLLIMELNAALDTGKFDAITLDEVKSRIDDGSILRFLRERLKGSIDLSVLLDTDTYGNFEEFYVWQLQAIYDACAGDERRKWGVQNRGRCLLIAWTNEILQIGTGWQPDMKMARRA